MNFHEDIDKLFHPRSVAVVGVSDKMGNAGKMFYESQRVQKFQGPLYAVHPSKDLDGIPTYRSLSDIPGPVDHIIICVPAQRIESVISDAVKKGVRCASIFTSGFAETGEDSDADLQARIVEKARKGGLRIIGPNCMGIHHPPAGLGFRPDMPTSWGRISMASQSGGIAISAGMIAALRGVPFGKIVSYGNESDLKAQDLLRYYSYDKDTDVIAFYVEGTRDGRELAEAIIEAGRKKPLIVLKGGRSQEGSRAASSHTGALAGDGTAWAAVLRQANAVEVTDLEEMIDTIEAYVKLDRPRGQNLGLLSISGGFGVIATDLVAEHGFYLPPFAPETADAISRHISMPGTSCRNPLDLAANIFWLPDHSPLFKPINDDPNIDALLILMSMEYVAFQRAGFGDFSEWFFKIFLSGLKNFSRPVAFVFFHSIYPEARLKLEQKILDAGYPVFPTVPRALNALSRRMLFASDGKPR